MTYKERKFETNKNFDWTILEQESNRKFNSIKRSQKLTLPNRFFEKTTLKHLPFMREAQIYKILDTIPKGVGHHIHSDCNEDLDFLKKFVLPNPNIYLRNDLLAWKYGTKQEALNQNWITIEEAKKKFNNDDQFEKAILKITQFSAQQVEIFSYKQTAWSHFEKKIEGFFAIFYQETLYKQYLQDYIEKYIQNGYLRIQVRSPLFPLRKDIDQNNLHSFTDLETFVRITEQVEKSLKIKYPQISIGVIFFALKMFNHEELEGILRTIYKIDSHLICGIDIVQEQDKYENFEFYEPVLRKIQDQYKSIKVIPGVFHAGQTRNISNTNVQKVINYGTKRIGHATNLFQHSYLIDQLIKKNIAIQVCPLSNQLLGYVYDLTQHPAISYYHLGVPISINPDDPSRFGYNGSTPDYYIAAHGFNFDLKDFKLLGIYSIEHSLCNQQQKQTMMIRFKQAWNKWIQKFNKQI